jgi:hypothetical protein
MTPQALKPENVYLTPTGRRCRLVPQAGRLSDWTWFEFQYIDHEGQVMPGTFTLTRANVKLLREAVH